MKDTVVLVTGSSSGLGLQMVKSLLEAGATTIATMRNIDGKNASVADELRRLPGNLHLIELDVSSDASVENGIQAALDQTGHIDVVINNAGLGSGGYTEAFSVEQMRRMLDVNVLGIHRVMRAVLPSMRERRSGLIINVSSAMGRIVIPFAGLYTASKYAVEGLSESYRYELATTGVDVVIVEPGGFMTPYWSGMMKPDDAARVETYGDAAGIADALWQNVPAMLSGTDAAAPSGFAQAVLDLIQMPAGQRPMRLVVDPVTGGGGPKAINATSEQVQRQVLESFGLTDLLSALP
jgi:NAD(P)-dependent dehydrogenase (short-subunit alcohol dehydrogenase family)